MQPRYEQQKLTEGQTKVSKPRFHIEKLEQRIAPAKGGIPGPPDGNGPGVGGCNGQGYHGNGCYTR